MHFYRYHCMQAPRLLGLCCDKKKESKEKKAGMQMAAETKVLSAASPAFAAALAVSGTQDGDRPVALFAGAKLSRAASQDTPETVQLVLIEDVLESFVAHYYHFVEFVLQACAALLVARLDRAQVTSVVVRSPAGSRTALVRGAHQDINAHLVRALFPRATFFGFEETEGSAPLPLGGGLERGGRAPLVLEVARKAADHRGINKFNAGVLHLFHSHPSVLDQLAVDVQRYCEGDSAVHQGRTLRKPLATARDRTGTEDGKQLPVFLYVTRTGVRKLEPELERRLLASVEAQGLYRVETVAFEQLGFREQIQCVQRASVLCGVHGNGLTHALFLRPGSAVIELFGDFRSIDYCFLSLMRHHTYVPVGSTMLDWKQMMIEEHHRSVNQPVTKLDISGLLRALRALAMLHA